MKVQGAIKTDAELLVEEMLRTVRREFFADNTDKQFFQEQNMLVQAISLPADWLERRAAELPAGEQRKIIQLVIDTIKQHGNRAKIKRFSAYFLHCVQLHMTHHGDEYYYAAKAAKPIGPIVAGTLSQVAARQRQAGHQADSTTRILAEAHRLSKSRGGRRKRPTEKQAELF